MRCRASQRVMRPYRNWHNVAIGSEGSRLYATAVGTGRRPGARDGVALAELASREPLVLFPAILAVMMPGLGQILNGRHIPRQWIKGFLFSWFFWYFLLRPERMGGPIVQAAVILFLASVADFVWTRRRYNQRITAAREQLGSN